MKISLSFDQKLIHFNQRRFNKTETNKSNIIIFICEIFDGHEAAHKYSRSLLSVCLLLSFNRKEERNNIIFIIIQVLNITKHYT